MSARTARDKLRVAHELRRRPLMADAFGAGCLSYCKVRAITRVVGADAEADRWLIRLAEAGTVADLDRAVRHWASLEEQDGASRTTCAGFDRRAVRTSRTPRDGSAGRRAPGQRGRGGAHAPRLWKGLGRRFT